MMTLLVSLIGGDMEEFNSKLYWEKRYATGGNSGAGSYEKFAEFKSAVLNEFVKVNNIDSVIELGCGDGNQLSYADYNFYIGVDVSPSAINICKQKFINDVRKIFLISDELKEHRADLAISLDVIFHLVEDAVFFNYMKQLFSVADKYVVIYSSNTDDNELSPKHIKHRNIEKYISRNFPNWLQTNKINNIYPYTGDHLTGSFSDFYIYQRR
ncbi:TPA: class I SAM-dependent methyltransferase [Aeromonas veronii]|nr:class I SAM-dependent methyltransferase [Aeromonas veronii]